MYKKILTEIDEKFLSQILVNYALKFAKINNAELWLYIIPEKDTSLEKLESILKKIFQETKYFNIPIQYIIETEKKLRKLKNILSTKEIDIAFLHLDNFKNLLGSPCSLVSIKIINIGKSFPKRVFFILSGKLDHLKEKVHFIENISKIFHPKIYITYFGKDKNIEEFFLLLRNKNLKFESKIFPKFSYKSAIFLALSKKSELIVIESQKKSFFNPFKLFGIKKLIENSPCNLLIFKPFQRDENKRSYS